MKGFTLGKVRRSLCALVLLLASAAGSSQAAVIYSWERDIAIPADENGIYVNVLTGTVTTIIPGDLESGPWINLFFGGTAIGSSGCIEPALTDPATGNGDGLVRCLSELEDIGPELNFALGFNGSENHTGDAPYQFESGIPGFLGFSVEMSEGGPVHYGWMQITVNQAGAGTLHDWGVSELAQESIKAGAVPEPGAPLLVLIAALPLGLSRSRRMPRKRTSVPSRSRLNLG